MDIIGFVIFIWLLAEYLQAEGLIDFDKLFKSNH